MARPTWARRSLYAGLVLMIVGLIDPLEGSLVIVAGTGLVALGAWLAHSRHRRLAAGGFLVLVLGVVAMFVLSGFGGVGGSSGRSWWWALTVLPYPLGWVLSLLAGLRMRRERSEPPPA